MRKGNFAGFAASTKRKRRGKGTLLGSLLVLRGRGEERELTCLADSAGFAACIRGRGEERELCWVGYLY